MRRLLVPAVVAALTLASVLVAPTAVLAQDTPATVGTTPDIIPRPNSGESPSEAGDRGGALQLLVLGLVVVGIGGAATHLVRQSRRARPTSGG